MTTTPLTKGFAVVALTFAFALTGCGADPVAPDTSSTTGVNAAVAAANGYRFTIVVDNDRDGFDAFGFGCPAMNEAGVIAFHGIRAFSFASGIFRSGPRLTAIALDEGQFGFIGVNPSINNRGDVSFAASVGGGEYEILRGSGGALTTIAETETGPFAFFGFDTSIDDAGNVAFKAELDNFDEGLFHGAGGPATTVYLASTSKFLGHDGGPAFNPAGQIAFQEDLDDGGSGMFLWTGSRFITIATDRRPPIGGFFRPPSLNAGGVVGFHAFLREGGNEAIFKGSGGPLTRVADSRGAYSSFDFGGPSINDPGVVAFSSTLDTGEQGIFVGPDPVADRVILAGDALGGATTTNFVFCREGINNRGQLAFLAFLDDGRSLIVRATPPNSVPDA